MNGNFESSSRLRHRGVALAMLLAFVIAAVAPAKAATPTTTALSVSPTPSATGETITLTALVTVTAGGQPVSAGGTVTFLADGVAIGSPAPVTAGGLASVTTSSLAQGARTLSANYSGTAGGFDASSASVVHFVDAPTTVQGAEFCNSTPLTIPNAVGGKGAPYPTRIRVSGVVGTISKVTVRLNGFTHQFPSDVDMMLSGPNGNSLVLFSDVGGSTPVSAATFVLDSGATSSLPGTTLTSGTFRPTDLVPGDTFPAPAPTANVFSASTTSLGTAFNGIVPNGIWTLYTVNDSAGAQGGGALSGGWCVIFIVNPAPYLVLSKTAGGTFAQAGAANAAYFDLAVANPSSVATSATVTVTDAMPAGLSVSGLSAGAGWNCGASTSTVVTCTYSLGIGGFFASPPVRVFTAVAADASASITNTATIASSSAGDLTNQSASATVAVQAIPSVSVSVPVGAGFTLNGTAYTGTTTVKLPAGSYTLATTTPQAAGAGTRLAFTGWSDGGAISHSVTVGPAGLAVTGSFTTQHQLTTAAGAGGTVTPASGTFFDAGTNVALTATPNAGFAFAGWSGPVASPSSTSTTVTLNAPASVSATFVALPAPVALTVSKTGAGTGTVSSFPAGIDCGATCTANFGTGTAVTLAAAPAADAFFAGWGGACSGRGGCTVTMDAAKSVTAEFRPFTSISRFANIATRSQVLTGNDVMIAGFIIQGDAPQTVVVRARGPSLAAFGITNALADPVLQLFAGQTVIATNDDWQSSPDAAVIQSSGFAPSDAKEAVIRITLQPGAYTAIVSGKNGGTGVGIVEVFAQ